MVPRSPGIQKIKRGCGMSDICDQADEVIEKTREQALAQIPRYTGISAFECECGEEIPEGRRLAIPGVRLCAG